MTQQKNQPKKKSSNLVWYILSPILAVFVLSLLALIFSLAAVLSPFATIYFVVNRVYEHKEFVMKLNKRKKLIKV